MLWKSRFWSAPDSPRCRMRSKYLVGAITGSLVLHLAVFWPQPDSLSPSAPSHILFAQLGQVPTPIAAPNTTLEHSLRPAKSPSAPDPRQRSGTNETRVPTKASVPREVVRRSSEPSARSSGPNDVSGGAPVPGAPRVTALSSCRFPCARGSSRCPAPASASPPSRCRSRTCRRR